MTLAEYYIQYLKIVEIVQSMTIDAGLMTEKRKTGNCK